MLRDGEGDLFSFLLFRSTFCLEACHKLFHGCMLGLYVYVGWINHSIMTLWKPNSCFIYIYISHIPLDSLILTT